MINWKALASLREHFLSERPHTEDYWDSPELMEDYDQTFGERIGWKWDSVLDETEASLPALRKLRPAVVDWGCGTGIASRRFLKIFGSEPVSQVTLIDRSTDAQKFATRKIQELGDSIKIAPITDPAPPFILLISHVLGELATELPADLQIFLNQATAIFWIEPGTPALSRRLIEVRERMRDRFHVIAPCPHQLECGLKKPGNETHWCHHFAKVPPVAFQNSTWTRFGRELGIDLRSLPISYLVMVKPELAGTAPKVSDRIIGRARHYTGYLKVLVCEQTGVEERRLLERSSRSQFKRLKKGGFCLRYLT
jgi:hypothetical protein